ncbi:MarR family winged helix-turn-helix transcriptional regulator [Thalassotalea castellviae]|uniref:Winged helix DNA-binding protein n=1 Tax=Thalassotalea castellviae TaxID=3075612 RepID=A0ABU3A121_9GAMM|nr:MarR family transcriptional regulator [Thalassotalea sp. W431]MDT0603878.1 winged helix DNA-binding protein [Thalassotalea sp. W431]
MTIINPLEDKLGYHIRRASIMMFNHLNSLLKTLDLSTMEASVLLFIGANANIKQITICNHLGVKKANMAPLMSTMIKRGLVHKNKLDGRSYGFTLTEEGERTVVEISKCMAINEEWMLENTSFVEKDFMLTKLKMIWNK